VGKRRLPTIDGVTRVTLFWKGVVVQDLQVCGSLITLVASHAFVRRALELRRYSGVTRKACRLGVATDEWKAV
jgi:hypothetical protein